MQVRHHLRNFSKYLLGIGIIKVDNPEDNPDQRLRTFQRNLEKLQKP